MQPRRPPEVGYPVPALEAAFDHSPCIFHWLPPVKVTSGTLKVHAHLSPFSAPLESYQPVLLGSVRASDSSCPLTLARAANPSVCTPEVSSGSQPGSPSSFQKNANWTGMPLQLP